MLHIRIFQAVLSGKRFNLLLDVQARTLKGPILQSTDHLQRGNIFKCEVFHRVSLNPGVWNGAHHTKQRCPTCHIVPQIPFVIFPNISHGGMKENVFLTNHIQQ